jgi:hypothetical protein
MFIIKVEFVRCVTSYISPNCLSSEITLPYPLKKGTRVFPRVTLHVFGVEKSLLPLLGMEPQIVQPVAYLHIDYAVLAPLF